MIKQNDLMFLYHDDKRNFMIKAEDKTLHTDKGFIKVSSLIGKKFGEKVEQT